MPSREQLLSLCDRLRGERLLVSSELDLLQELNVAVDKSLNSLLQVTWICREQQLNLFKVISGVKDATPENSFRYVRQLSGARFEQSYHSLGQHDALVSAVLQTLLRNPSVVAKILNAVEGQPDGRETAFELSHTLFSSLYGCCVFASDEKVVLETLLHLIRLQIVPSPNPRRMIRRGNCSFTKLYGLFSEGLFSAKVFLTAALHEPVMELLSQDELFLDIDPSKAVIRFPPEERMRRFGEEGTDKFKLNLEKYRKVIWGKLVSISNKFIEGIRLAMPQFPSSLAWLVRQLYQLLMSGQKVSKEEISLLCTDLIFTCFICPAIANPEPLGVIADTPITYIARFNLMQVGQILQTLAVWPWERADSRLKELYAQFDPDCMSNVVSNLLEGEAASLDVLFSHFPNSTDSVLRPTALITLNELKRLLSVLSRPALLSELNNDGTIVELESNLRKMPQHLRQPAAGAINGHDTPQHLAKADSLSPPNKRKSLGRNWRPGRGGQEGGEDSEHRIGPHGDSNSPTESNPQVLMISLSDHRDPVGLLSEGRYMADVKQTDRSSQKSIESNEKRARFVDTESVATSGEQFEGGSDGNSLSSSLNDHPEDISTLADNFSDVAISANVSGRGSPNISDGRETPLSQNTEQHGQEETEDVPSCRSGIPVPERNLPPLPVVVQKENRDDIEDKFGKFGLPQPPHRDRLRDETHSMVSDSWSTDVVPSDNEGAGEASGGMQAPGGIVPAGTLPDVVPGAPPDFPRLDLIREEVQAVAVAADAEAAAAIEDRSDTWSVDAIASDSEAEPVRQEELADLVDEDTELAEAVAASAMDVEEDLTQTLEEAQLEGRGAFYSVPDVRFMDASNSEQTTPPTSAKLSAPVTVAPENAPLTKETLRRQSSGSSFYSRSDVDSEFSRDYPDDASSAFAGDFPQPPSSRGSIAEGATTGLRKREDLALSQDDVTLESNRARTPDAPFTTERQSLGRLSFVLGDESKVPRTNGDGKVLAAGSGGNSTNSSEASNDETRRAQWRASGAIPKSSRQSRPTGTRGPYDNKHNAQKMKMGGLLHGLQKVGESLRSKGRPSLSPFRSSKTVEDINIAGGRKPIGVPQSQSSSQIGGDQRTADEILNKYSSPVKPLPGPTRITVNQEPQEDMDTNSVKDENEQPYYDPENVTRCLAFSDAKRKLRVVLSSIDTASLPAAAFESVESSASESKRTHEQDLSQFLRLLLAEAINGQQRTLSAQLREVIRCLAVFDHKGVKKLIRVLKEEHRHRSGYLTYLQQSRVTLLQMRANLDTLTNRIEREQSLTAECLVEVLVRFFLQQREAEMRKFVAEFQQLVAQDEKTDLVERFLKRLYVAMEGVSSWQRASSSQIEYAHKSLERSLMAQVYLAALYPNGDADVCRDQVLHDYMKKLAAIITPSHRALAIPRSLHAECPWPSAQAEISIINAYKSPRDKLSCVVRCCETIQNLISMAIAKPSAADHILPVLVYVLIQANPPALLSNIQYVHGFYSNRMEGADAYWWTQFTSAVEFIKSLFNNQNL